MFFIFLVYGAALTLEMLGSFISVIGLSSKTSHIIILLIISLDFSKVMIATVLYKKWKDIHLLFKFVLTPALCFLILVTSSGTYAFLVQEFSKTTASQEQMQTKIDLMVQEKNKLEARKKEIDTQIAQLPPESVVQRKRLTDLFSKESNYINSRTQELDKDIPDAKIQNMEDTTHAGTLGSIASAYGTTPGQISKIVAFFLVIVIDPLAIVLLTVANFLTEQRKKQQFIALTEPELIIGHNLTWLEKLKGKASPSALAKRTVLLKYEKEQKAATEFTGVQDLVETTWASKKHKLTPQYIVQKAYLVDTPKYVNTGGTVSLDTFNSLHHFVAPTLTKNTQSIDVQEHFLNVIIEPTVTPSLELNQILNLQNNNNIQEYAELFITKDELKIEPREFILSANAYQPKIISEIQEIKNQPLMHDYVSIDVNKEIRTINAREIIQNIDITKNIPLEKNHAVLLHLNTPISDKVEYKTSHIIKSLNLIDNIYLTNLEDFNEPEILPVRFNFDSPMDSKHLIPEYLNIEHDNLEELLETKTDPLSMLRKNANTGSDGFYDSKEEYKFIPSNAPDIPLDYDEEVTWDDEHDDFNIGVAKAVEPIIIKGFSTLKALEELVF